MTAVAERAGAPGAPVTPGLGVRFGWAVTDTLTITRRNLLVWMRVPAYLVFGVAICCISAFTGLAIGDEESVQAFGLIWLFPLTFLSSAFVPIATMPGWLQAFANNQPVTYVVDTMRALALGGPVAASLWKSVAWLAGIFIVFLPLAVRAYRRAS